MIGSVVNKLNNRYIIAAMAGLFLLGIFRRFAR
jgi:hypothetical protein